ncbi:MAG: hypothetical protein EBU46_06390 [Nitrosomonadaceae bacterium]|nr:hypothetical protein [Nitrosomonadaceae bacterium]
MDFDVVFVAATTESQRWGHNIIFAVGADICVASLDDPSNKPPWMIVEETFVVTAIPLVQPDGKQPAVQHPTPHVRTLLQPQRFIPS